MHKLQAVNPPFDTASHFISLQATKKKDSIFFKCCLLKHIVSCTYIIVQLILTNVDGSE